MKKTNIYYLKILIITVIVMTILEVIGIVAGLSADFHTRAVLVIIETVAAGMIGLWTISDKTFQITKLGHISSFFIVIFTYIFLIVDTYKDYFPNYNFNSYYMSSGYIGDNLFSILWQALIGIVFLLVIYFSSKIHIHNLITNVSRIITSISSVIVVLLVAIINAVLPVFFGIECPDLLKRTAWAFFVITIASIIVSSIGYKLPISSKYMELVPEENKLFDSSKKEKEVADNSVEKKPISPSLSKKEDKKPWLKKD